MRSFCERISSNFQATAYGQCISRVAESVTKDACAKEFKALMDCVQKVVSYQCQLTSEECSLSAEKATKMKVHRAKRVQRLLAFYRNNYDVQPPYHLLIDGTFCAAALANQINIREQLVKYIGREVRLLTTKCVLGRSLVFFTFLCFILCSGNAEIGQSGARSVHDRQAV